MSREALAGLRMVEVGIHDECNRRCAFCTNSLYPRAGRVELDSSVYRALLDDLAAAGFDGTVSFSRFNEPMSRPTLLKQRVREARRLLPRARLVLNTNGDFLSGENLDGLEIDELSIMDYDGVGADACAARLTRTGAEPVERRDDCILARRGRMRLAHYFDWLSRALLTDRGGCLELPSRRPRLAPCLYPARFAAVECDGTVMPCCDMRADVPGQGAFALGNLHRQGIEAIWRGERAAAFRSRLAAADTLPEPCRQCQREAGRYVRDRPGILFVEEP